MALEDALCAGWCVYGAIAAALVLIGISICGLWWCHRQKRSARMRSAVISPITCDFDDDLEKPSTRRLFLPLGQSDTSGETDIDTSTDANTDINTTTADKRAANKPRAMEQPTETIGIDIEGNIADAIDPISGLNPQDAEGAEPAKEVLPPRTPRIARKLVRNPTKRLETFAVRADAKSGEFGFTILGPLTHSDISRVGTGLFVADVTAGSVAAASGLSAGLQIVSVDGYPVSAMAIDALSALFSSSKPDMTVTTVENQAVFEQRKTLSPFRPTVTGCILVVPLSPSTPPTPPITIALWDRIDTKRIEKDNVYEIPVPVGSNRVSPKANHATPTASERSSLVLTPISRRGSHTTPTSRRGSHPPPTSQRGFQLLTPLSRRESYSTPSPRRDSEVIYADPADTLCLTPTSRRGSYLLTPITLPGTPLSRQGSEVVYANPADIRATPISRRGSDFLTPLSLHGTPNSRRGSHEVIYDDPVEIRKSMANLSPRHRGAIVYTPTPGCVESATPLSPYANLLPEPVYATPTKQ
eukprot:m.22466 g.22466  ORF g.22466 m.22466 type:complete len:528 (+) comp10742_c0_seq1:279-1862(+)